MKKTRMMFVVLMVIAPFFLKGGEAEAESVKINAKNFPNYYFMVYVRNNYDTNKDWKLSEKERNAVTEINVGEASEYQLGLEYPGPDTVQGSDIGVSPYA